MTPDIRSAKHLATLAYELIESGGADPAHAKLKAEIEALLAARKDGVFEAVHPLIDEDEVAAELESRIDDASQITELFVGWDGAGPRPSEAMLFAMPVILGILPGEAVPAEIPQVDRLVEGLRRHGLVGSHPGIYLAPEFLRLRNVDMPPSRRRLLLQSLVTRYFGGAFDLLPGNPAAGGIDWDALESGFPQLALGFLVGTVIAALETGEHPFYPDDTEADEYDERCHAWSEEASAWLEAQTGYTFALALPPEILSDAIKTGIDEYRATVLAITAKSVAIASPAGTPPRQAEVELTGAGGPEATVRIAIHGSGGFVTGYSWPLWPFDDDEATLARVLDILEGEGVVQIETVLSGER